MLRLLVAFTTYDGYTAKIAKRIASTPGHADCATEVCDPARSRPERPLEDYDGVIVGGPLHGGKHPRQLVKFVSKNRKSLNERRNRQSDRLLSSIQARRMGRPAVAFAVATRLLRGVAPHSLSAPSSAITRALRRNT